MNARALVVLTLCARAALGADFLVDSPLNDERVVLSGRLGASPGDVSARGLFVSGTRADVPFTQAGGEVIVQGGLQFFQTTFGGIFGVEADFSLGGASNEASADGTVRDQRKAGGTPEERAEKLVWVTSRLGARATLSLPMLVLSERVVFRLGVVGGALLEANGSRSFEFSPAFTAGAQLGFVLGPLAGLLSYLAVPTQGLEQTLTRHKLGVELGLGPVVLGASWQLDAVTFAPLRGVPQGPLGSQTFSFHAGYRFPQLDFR